MQLRCSNSHRKGPGRSPHLILIAFSLGLLLGSQIGSFSKVNHDNSEAQVAPLIVANHPKGDDNNNNGLTSSQKKNDLPRDFCKTSSTGYEIVLESFLGLLFQEEDSLLPAVGDVLDVGAQFGEQACHFARLAPSRQVHAMDPSLKQTTLIRDKFASKLPNLNVVHAGIGSTVGTGVAAEGFTGMESGETFAIETMDHFFHDLDRKLAFAHIDVEGMELDVLRGGTKTIQDNHPLFTVEVRVHKEPNYTIALLDYIDEIGYDAYVVDEPCGWPHMDYRNLVCFPRFEVNEKLVHSDAFNLAAASEAIFRVDSSTIFAKVYPECALGGELCQTKSTVDKNCCHERIVQQWHQKTRPKPVAMQGFTYSRRATLSLWSELRKRKALMKFNMTGLNLSSFCSECLFDMGKVKLTCAQRASYFVSHYKMSEREAREAVMVAQPQNCKT